jgi:hypothetical protein
MSTRFRSLQYRSALLLTALVSAVGCDAGKAPPTGIEAPPPDIRPYVAGEAAAALSASGTFPYAGPTHDRGERMISPERAGELALAYVRAFGQFFHRSWEKDAGRSIHLPSLRVDTRVFFAEAPYGRFPEGPFHPAYRKIFGPEYIVTLTDGRTPVLLVGVSAYNTDVAIDERGLVVTPPDGGSEFTSFGIPSDTSVYTHLTPERAVARVGHRTGARVLSPPVLLQMSAFHHPVLAVWRLSLDRPVPVRTVSGAAQKKVRDVYLNGRGQYLMPADEQPRGFTDRFLIATWDAENRQRIEATVPIVSGSITEWIEVVPERSF